MRPSEWSMAGELGIQPRRWQVAAAQFRLWAALTTLGPKPALLAKGNRQVVMDGKPRAGMKTHSFFERKPCGCATNAPLLGSIETAIEAGGALDRSPPGNCLPEKHPSVGGTLRKSWERYRFGES